MVATELEHGNTMRHFFSSHNADRISALLLAAALVLTGCSSSPSSSTPQETPSFTRTSSNHWNAAGTVTRECEGSAYSFSFELDLPEEVGDSGPFVANISMTPTDDNAIGRVVIADDNSGGYTFGSQQIEARNLAQAGPIESSLLLSQSVNYHHPVKPTKLGISGCHYSWAIELIPYEEAPKLQWDGASVLSGTGSAIIELSAPLNFLHPPRARSKKNEVSSGNYDIYALTDGASLMHPICTESHMPEATFYNLIDFAASPLTLDTNNGETTITTIYLNATNSTLGWELLPAKTEGDSQ